MEITTDYTNLALAYRNRLLYLFLSNKEQDQFNQLHSQLTQFLRLTHLEVQLENNNGGLFDLELIEIEGCKSLNSIKFESKSQNDLTINKAPQDRQTKLDYPAPYFDDRRDEAMICPYVMKMDLMCFSQ